ncbi:MAG TPA: universal stress protein, partial [Ginsengibacter sp.]
LLILSQVILSLQLGFAIIPLIHFVSDKSKMGSFVIKPPTKIIAWLIAAVLIWLNVQMLFSQCVPVFEGNAIISKMVIIISALFFTILLLYIIIEPTITRRKMAAASIKIHPEMENIILDIPLYNRIAIALDFSEHDIKLISYAIGQGNEHTQYILMHIVESASAKLWGSQSDDYETRKDHAQLDSYVNQLKEKGFNATGLLGYRNRAKEIVRLVKESNADMLVVGAHGHTGIKDLIYGETVDSVRHALKIPVLMVSLKES